MLPLPAELARLAPSLPPLGPAVRPLPLLPAADLALLGAPARGDT